MTTKVQHGNTLMAAYVNLREYCKLANIVVRKLEWLKGAPELVIINDSTFLRIADIKEMTPGYYMTKAFVRHHKEMLSTLFRCQIRSICPSSVSGRFVPLVQFSQVQSIKELE